MTDKEQIMINDIDVSECENFRPKDRFTCYPYICNCHEKPNCYFKQLARKTQECEGIKEECEALKLENKELYRILADLKEERKLKDKYKHECEELKKDIEERRLASLQMRESLCQEVSQKLRLLEALEEINKVINNIFDRCLGHKTDGCTPVHNVCEELIKILDIINKAKGGEDE